MRKLQPIVFYAITKKHTKSKRAPPKVSKLVPFLLSPMKKVNEAGHGFKCQIKSYF